MLPFQRIKASHSIKGNTANQTLLGDLKNNSFNVLGILSFPEKDLRRDFLHQFIDKDFTIQQTYGKCKLSCVIRLQIYYYEGQVSRV
jgi:hypothetical protein